MLVLFIVHEHLSTPGWERSAIPCFRYTLCKQEYEEWGDDASAASIRTCRLGKHQARMPDIRASTPDATGSYPSVTDYVLEAGNMSELQTRDSRKNADRSEER